MLIEFGDSWFIAKTILVVIPYTDLLGQTCRKKKFSIVQYFCYSEWNFLDLMVCQNKVAKDFDQERNNSIHRLKFLSNN